MKRTAIATMRAILYSIILASVVGFCLMTYGRAQNWWWLSTESFVSMRVNEFTIQSGIVVQQDNSISTTMNYDYGNYDAGAPDYTGTSYDPETNETIYPLPADGGGLGMPASMVGKKAMLLYGNRNFPLIFQWACTLLIVICTSLLRLLDKHQPPAAPHNVNQKPSKAQIVAALFHRILFYQVPPRPFWMHLTSGMSLVDLLVYFSWLGLAAVWLYQTNMNAWAANDAAAIDAGWSLSDLALQRIYSVGVNFGVAVRGCLILLFYPVSRSNFLHWLFGVDFYTVVKYHKWFGIGTICLIWAHGLTLMIYWGAQGTWAEETFQYQAFAESNLAGFLAAAVVTVTFASSLEWFRRSFFHFWKKLHVFSAFAFLCLAFMHEPSIVFYVLPGLLLYLLDKTCRGWQYTNSTTLVPGQDILISKGSNIITIALEWAPSAWLKPGQTLFLTLPEISLLQAHPFSIASVTRDNESDPAADGDEESRPSTDRDSPPQAPPSHPSGSVVTHLHIKAGAGAWTTTLMARLEEPSNRKPILCAVEGPYDDLPALPTHKIVVMIAGGTGITPILGILRSWIAQPSLAPAMVYLIWTSRSFEELCLLDSALVDLASNDRSSSAPWKLVLSLHYTGQKTIDAKHSYCATVVEAEESMQDLSENVSQAEVKKETSMSSTVSRSDSRVLDQQPNNKIMTRVSTFYRSFSSVKVLNAANAEASPPVAAYNKPLLVPTPSNNPLLYSLLAILCFFGAYGGLILPTWYQVDLAATTTDGAMWFALGMLYVVCVMAGATIPPLCLLLAIAAVRKTFASRSGKYATKKGLSAAFFSPSSIQVSNGGGLCLASKLTGYAVPVQTRRPDVKSALKRVLDQHRGEAEVPVYVGGPEGFMDVTRKEVEALNNERWVPSGPYLWFKKVVAW